ncbi:PAS domain-containing protein [Desulfosporosinus fructosivorans]
MNWTNAENIPLSNNQDVFTTRWRELIKTKMNFLSNNIDPRNTSYMVPEVAESWIRSKEFGVNPDMKTMGQMLSTAEIKELIHQNSLLIDTAVPLITTFKPLLEISGYLLVLFSSDGTILHQEGEPAILSSFNRINAVVGAVWSEKSVGTNAHSLSMRLKRPVQLLGPEHYCLQLEDNISSASPIMNEFGQVIGALVLVHQILGDSPWKNNLLNLQAHTLGWVSSMGVAIEAQLKLAQRNYALKMTNSTLKATLEYVDEGIISIDHEGKIKHLNREASRILRLSQDEAVGRDLKPFFGKQSNILKALTSVKPIEFLEVSITNQINELQYLLSIKPISEDDNCRNGAGNWRMP